MDVAHPVRPKRINTTSNWAAGRKLKRNRLPKLSFNRFMNKVALTLFVLLAIAFSGFTQSRKPNILHIHADDHRPDGLHALGTKLLQTPNLDTLVERGTTFRNCY